MKYSKVAARLREQIGRFSGELSKGLPKVSERLVSGAYLRYTGKPIGSFDKDRQGIGGGYFDQKDRGAAFTSVRPQVFGVYSST